ncbi:5-(carboxyamino)imidazole ribonucleotide synthase [Aciditerrimonas ferrireducens]|uniref:5-(carboxyamino)imidazole ribonucleotide synthase n=1 Tax=Aciditerrimonas ferrireducens TaxID=667306 RepID=UPI0020046407|nr:5-(carboxyamino)imidazole ribonucleotide synthase [Aciditerrimonas ferrireducens]MCK4178219.1 5-(carboxyamino)imidazole ribonucleotide synthase [Aciditerrimonas ferrireducens]
MRQERQPTGGAGSLVAPTEASAPSARVGMVGAGQLARMTYQAALDYGVALQVLARGEDEPAVAAGAEWVRGVPGNYEDLVALAEGSEVVTFDHEVIPPAHLRRLADAGHVLRPAPEAFVVSQDKWVVREVLGPAGFPFPAHGPAWCAEDVARFGDRYGWPLVLKATRGGYDGRGVRVLEGPAALGAQAAALFPTEGRQGDEGSEGPPWLVEEHLELAAECAVVLARRPSGQLACYPPIGTRQVEGICRELTVPADLPTTVLEEAEGMARAVAETIGATGVLALECFWTRDGRLLVNELALRPHNTGHITMEAAVTSQFHQHLRAVLDWPLGSSALRSPAATVNLIATDDRATVPDRLPLALEDPRVHVHLYGKAPRRGRKIGHLTVLGDDVGEALERARRAAGVLLGAEVNDPAGAGRRA